MTLTQQMQFRSFFEIVRESKLNSERLQCRLCKKVLKVLEDLCSVLGIETTKEEEILDEEIEKLIEERQRQERTKILQEQTRQTEARRSTSLTVI